MRIRSWFRFKCIHSCDKGFIRVEIINVFRQLAVLLRICLLFFVIFPGLCGCFMTGCRFLLLPSFEQRAEKLFYPAACLYSSLGDEKADLPESLPKVFKVFCKRLFDIL